MMEFNLIGNIAGIYEYLDMEGLTAILSKYCFAVDGSFPLTTEAI